MTKVSINPITRLEGHGKIEIFLNESGGVDNAYLQVPELRGFERFCIGRPVEEMPRITPKICGVCPGAHHMASAKAVDAVFGLKPTPTAKKLREIYYDAHMIHSHIAHFYALAAPDFVCGPTAPAAERNILGVVARVGLELSGEVIKHRSFAQKIQEVIGGKATHSVCALPGGMSRAITEEERRDFVERAMSILEFAKATQGIFENVILKNPTYLDIILNGPYKIVTHYLGLVDDKNQLNFYDGKLRLVDYKGKELEKFEAADYRTHIAEHVEPWTYLKFPYYKKFGWKGLKEDPTSGIYRAAPLARLNVSDRLATPLAQAEFEKFYKTLGGKPVHHTLTTHWARVIELLYAAEDLLNHVTDESVTDPNVRQIPDRVVGEGVGVVEAPRGTLFHHYVTDKNAIVTDVNLIVATGNNYAAMNLDIANAARGLIKDGKADQGILNMVEMAFRAYDPCLGCATHSLPGEMPLEVNIHDCQGNVVQTIKR